MSKLCLFLCVVLLVQAGRACDGNEDEQLAAAREQESIEYLANAYGFAPNSWGPYYQPRVSEYANMYEGRTPINKQQPTINPFRNYFNKNNAATENQAEGRFGISQLGATILNAGLFNNRFTGSGTTLNRPFAGIGNRLPISLNPNFASPISAFESCTAPSGEAGICSPGAVCSLFGGRPSGSCLLGGVCCINAITTCGGSVTLNNTYWQSPTTAVSAPSTCALTVKLNSALVEQKKPICQVRLDFVSFSIGGTGTTLGTCTDTFQVGGAVNSPPTICGDNSGQHMYVEVPSSATNPTDLQLMLNFAAGTTTTRSWNIKIAMLPCGASYLAPSNCLQYFTSGSGTVSSFNWKDVIAQRQLNNQNYNICFRTELVNSQRASNLCLAPCSTATNPFILSAGLSTAGAANAGFGNSGTALSTAANGLSAGCSRDFITFIGGSAGKPSVSADRFCGERLDPNNPSAFSTASVASICSTFKPFRILYITDGSEVTTATPAGVAPAPVTPAIPALDTLTDVGFCFTFTQS